MMNKKDTKINRNDMLELTRRMTLSRNCFVRAAGAYIDDEGYIDNTFNVSFKNMSKHDQQVNLDLAKTIPFSKTNEQLKCYKFPEGDMAYDSIHKLLMALSQYGLKDDLLVQTLCEQLAEGICDTKDSSDKINRLQGQEFGIYIYHGIYDIPKKGSDHSEQWESEEIYSFLICVVAPVDKDYNAGTPKCGFIFPAFEERSAEPGKIDVFFEISGASGRRISEQDNRTIITQIHEYRGRYSADNIQKELQINLQSHSLQPTKNMIPYSL